MEEVGRVGRILGEVGENIVGVLFFDGIGVGAFDLLLPVLSLRSLGMLGGFLRLKVIT